MAAPAFALLAATAFLAAASLRLRGLVPALLAAYLFAAAEIVGLTLVLSPFRAVAAPGYLVGEGVLAVLVAATWYRAGRPVPRRPALDLAALAEHPLLVALGLVVGLTMLFQLFLVVVAPPDNWDSMTYHLARAAAWYQHHSVGYLHDANTERLNVFPPNAEIGTLYTFAFVHGDRLAALPQLVAELAALAGCYAISRRLGFSRSSSAFATLRRRQIAQLVAFATAGALCFGSFGYAENLVHRHSLLGAGSEQNAFRAGLTPASFAARLGDIFARFLDLSGFRPILHSGAGLVALFAILIAAPPALWALDRRFGLRRGREPDARLLLGLAPVAVIVIGALEPELGIDVGINLRANEDYEFFGALGVALVLPTAAVTLVAALRQRGDLRRCALAAAIPLFALELAAAYEVNDWIGRFMISPAALTMPLVAAAYPARKLAAASVALAAVGCFTTVAFNEQKPTGLAGTTPG